MIINKFMTLPNLYTDRLRKTALESALSEWSDEPPFREAYDEADVREFLDTLPEDERTLFVMRYWQGYSSAELGKLFGLPAGTVRYKLSSARKRLKDKLNQ